MKPLTVAQIAWTAGLFDGEGCVFGCKTKERRGGHIMCELVNTYYPAMTELGKLFGGVVYTRPKSAQWKPRYSWRIWGKNAYRFALIIEPYSVIKRRQLRVLIEYHNGKPGGYFVTSKEERRRSKLLCQLKSLNGRGA